MSDVRKMMVVHQGKGAELVEGKDSWTVAKKVIGEGNYIQVIPFIQGLEFLVDEDAIAKALPFNRNIPAVAPNIDLAKFDFLLMHRNLALPGSPGVYKLRGSFVIARSGMAGGSLTPKNIEMLDMLLGQQITIACPQCGRPRPSQVQIYCGGGCSARAEAHEPPMERT